MQEATCSPPQLICVNCLQTKGNSLFLRPGNRSTGSLGHVVRFDSLSVQAKLSSIFVKGLPPVSIGIEGTRRYLANHEQSQL